MNNLGSAIVRAVALASGVVVGAMLANLVDKYISTQAQEQHDYDKSRYAQGLAPLNPQPQPPQEQQS